MTETEPGMGLAVLALADCLLEKIIPEKPAEKPTRKQELMRMIEEATLHSRTGASYHKGIHDAFGKDYTASEINQAIHTLRKHRILNQHQGPEDISYTHNNRFKQWFASLPYVQ